MSVSERVQSERQFGSCAERNRDQNGRFVDLCCTGHENSSHYLRRASKSGLARNVADQPYSSHIPNIAGISADCPYEPSRILFQSSSSRKCGTRNRSSWRIVFWRSDRFQPEWKSYRFDGIVLSGELKFGINNIGISAKSVPHDSRFSFLLRPGTCLLGGNANI
jgi:hypothetical protein